MYQARILDKNRRLVAILPGVAWRYQREANKATGIEVMIPKEVVDIAIRDEHELLGYFRPAQMVFGNKIRVAEPTRENKAGYANLASFVQIFKGETLKASGKITGRSLGQVITVEALTEEILLEQNRTPAQYGKVWEGWDLADVARDLRFGWAAKRIKAPEQWTEAIVASSNIDYTTDPGHLMLAKTTHGVYREYGYVTIRCNRSQIANFEKWDRVRWSADSDGMDNPDKIVWTTIQTSTDGSSWSAEWDGGLPEEVGLAFEGTSDEMWVRINLYTNDTISPAEGDEEGPPVGQTPVVFAVELVARTQPILEIGSIPATAGVTVKDLDANYSTAFEVIAKACEQTCWEFNVWDGTLNLAENLGVDRTKDFIFRAGSNIEITTLNDGDENLCNILTAYNQGQGLNALELTLTDQDGLADYGPYPKAMEFDAETIEDLETQAMDYLAEYAQPTPQYAIAVAFDVDKEPEYGVGDLVQVADPETGTVTTTRIMVEEREYAETGLTVRLELGKASINLSEAIRYQRPKDGQDGKDGKDGRPGRDGRDGKDGQPGGDADIPIPEDPEWLDYEFTSHLTVTWRKSDYATGYEVRTNLNWGSASGLIFRGYAHSHSFVPMSRNFDLYIRAYNAMDEPSVNYDTMEVLLPIPETPSLPTIHSYFSALQIHVTPLPSPAILGYYLYLTEDGTITTDKVPIRAGEHLTYQAPSGTTFEVQVSAFDVLGEGDKSAVLIATTNSLDILEIPEIPKTKLEESLRTEITTAGAKADQAMEDVGNLETLTNDYLNEVNTVKGRIADAEDGLTSAVDRLNSVDSELDGAKQRLLDAEGRLSSVDNEIADAKDRLTGAESRLTATETDLTDARTRLTSAEGSITDAEARLVDAENRLSSVDSEIDGAKTRLTDVESDISGISTRVGNAETNLTDARTRLTAAEGGLSDAVARITDAEDNIAGIDTRVASAETNLADAESRILDVESDISGIDGVVTQHGQSITNIEGELSSKVSQTEFDALEGVVSEHSTTLTQHATKLEAKAESSVVDTLTGRVDEHESVLTAHATAIEARVTETTFETLEGRVTTNEAEIAAHATEIASKVSQSVYDDLAGTVDSHSTTITQHAGLIEAKAEQSEVDSLGGIVSNHTTTLSQHATAIESKASQDEVDTLSGIVSSHGTTLTQHADKIEQKAERTVVDTLSGVVSNHTATLSTHATQIAGKVAQETFEELEGDVGRISTDLSELAVDVSGISASVESVEGEVDSLTGEVAGVKSRTADLEIRATGIEANITSIETDVDEIEDRVTVNEATLTAHADQIEARVTQTVFDALSGVVDAHTAELVVLADELSAKVSQTIFDELEGVVADNTAEITAHATQIQARVEKTVFDALEDRVETNEASIIANATEIASKVSQSVFDGLAGTVTDLSTTVTQTADALESKADQSIVDTLSGTVASQGTQITQNATAIESKADQSVVDTLSDTVSDQSTLISQNATAITQKADKSTVDTLTGRVSTAEATLSTHADEIEARATKEEVDTIEGRVTEAEGQLTVQAGKIEAKAEKTEVQALEDDLSSVSNQVGTLTTSYDNISARVTSVEGVTDDLTDEVSGVKSRTGNLEVRAGNIEANVSSLEEDIDEHGNRLLTVEDAVVNVLPGQIALKANASEIYKKGEIDTKLGQKADSATVSGLTTRITDAEFTIEAHTGAIAQKAERSEVYTKSEVDTELGTKVDTTTYTNKIGELTTSIDGITGRVESTEINVNNLTGEVDSVKTDVSQLDIRADGIQSTVSSLGTNMDDVTSQVTQLANEITLKVQKKVNGELVVTGIGVGFDEHGQSVVPILADRFMVVPTVEGEGQYAFLVDSNTGKVYIPGSLTVGGLLRATELQADLARVLLLQAEVAFLDQANVLHLKADRISVGAGVGFAQTKPSGHLWHFDRHLSSTDGIAPTAATGTSIVPDQGIAGGALEVASGGTVTYDLPMAMDTWTWAGFFSIGE